MAVQGLEERVGQANSHTALDGIVVPVFTVWLNWTNTRRGALSRQLQRICFSNC